MKRKVSWLAGVLAYTLPPAGVYAQQAELAREAEAQGTFVCGLPALASVFLAVVCAVVFSGIALAFSYSSLHSLPVPRPAWRVVEFVVLSVPMILWLTYAIVMFTF